MNIHLPEFARAFARAPRTFKVRREQPIGPWMEIPGLSSSAFRADFEAAREVLALRKQRDVEQEQAQALLRLVQQAAEDGNGQLIDVRV